MSKITFVVDVDRCIGCHGCQVACKMENAVGLGSNRTLVKDIGPTGTYPDIQLYFLPVMCQHCENPNCVEVCPTGACHMDRQDGVVRIDTSSCIGCKSCQNACPYGANTWNPDMRVMDKCNICLQRRECGEIPACVKNCSGRALHVGDIEDPDSEVSKLLHSTPTEYIHTLHDFGNHPSVRYILRNAVWIDCMPQEVKETKRRRL